MDDFKGTIVKITKGVTKTSGNFLKSAKLTMSLSSEEDNLKKIYIDIGKKVHEIYLYGGSLGKVFDERYQAILETEAKIRELRDKLNAVKGAQTCPNCGKSIDRAAAFCPKCGFQTREERETPDAGRTSGPDSGRALKPDVGRDSGRELRPDAGPNLGRDSGRELRPDAGPDSGRTLRPDTGLDAGPELPRPDFEAFAHPLGGHAKPEAETAGYGPAVPKPTDNKAPGVRPNGVNPSNPDPARANPAMSNPAGARPLERPAESPEPPAPRCAACGAEAEPGAKFCLSCGRILR